MERKSLVQNKVFTAVLLLYLLHEVPIIGEYMPSMMFAGIVVTLTLLTIQITGNYFLRLLSLALVICSVSFIRDISTSSSLAICFYSLLQNVISLVIGLYVVKINDYSFSKFILIVLLITYTITAITTFWGNLAIPEASRILATASDNDMSLRSDISKLNIGGFTFIYTLVLWIPLLLGALKFWRKWFVVLFSVVASFYLAIYVSEYTTALLLAVLPLLLLFSKKGLDYKSTRIYALLFIGIVIIVVPLLPSVIQFFDSSIDSHLISARLSEVSDYVSNPQYASSDSQSDLIARQNLYLRSFSSFLQSPLWGSLSYSKLGSHSTFFDILGFLGLIGGALYYFLWKNIYVNILKPYKYKPFFGYFYFAFICSIILSIINPFFPVFFYSFIVPSTIVCLDNSK